MADAEVELKALAKKIGRRVETVVQEFVNDLAEQVIIVTPVDTGFLRGSWFMSLNEIEATMVGEADPTGTIAISNISLKVGDIEPGDRIFILNGAEYAEAIENGHSSQAPNGMVKSVVANASDILEMTVKRIAA